MSAPAILGRMSHGNEPIIRVMKIASYFPECDVVFPVPEDKKAFLQEIADGNGVDRKRVYIDSTASCLAQTLGLYWAGNMNYGQWVKNNATRLDYMDQSLTNHYKSFWPKNLEGEERHFKAGDVKMVLNAGDIYDNFGLDAPIVYEFPHRHSELFRRSEQPGLKGFGLRLEEREKTRTVNFIPLFHSLHYDSRYRPLKNEEFTPHMKEGPIDFDITLPESSIGMVFSGTGKKIEFLEQVAASTGHPVVTGNFSPVGDGMYIKMKPPKAGFVHVYAKPQILAVVGQTGYGMLGDAWNAGKPIISPPFAEGDDEEFMHNLRTIRKLGLGVVIERPDQIDEAVKRSRDCIPEVTRMNEKIEKEFGTLDGPAYVARRIRELGLY